MVIGMFRWTWYNGDWRVRQKFTINLEVAVIDDLVVIRV